MCFVLGSELLEHSCSCALSNTDKQTHVWSLVKWSLFVYMCYIGRRFDIMCKNYTFKLYSSTFPLNTAIPPPTFLIFHFQHLCYVNWVLIAHSLYIFRNSEISQYLVLKKNIVVNVNSI